MVIKNNELVVLYINKQTKKMELRAMYTKPTEGIDEIFMAIIEFKDACTICNRYNNEIAFKG